MSLHSKMNTGSQNINNYGSTSHDCSANSTVESENWKEDEERRPLLEGRERRSNRDGGRMLKICCSVSAGVFGVLFLIFGIIVGCLFDPFISSVIDKELVIKNDETSEVYKLWVNPPIVPYLKVYFFNLTNSEDFLRYKVKPVFKEVGPYSYREKWKKVNVSFHENGTVTYQTRKFYYFDRSKSYGPEEDVIHTLNVPVNVAVERASKMGRFMQLALSSMMAVLNETAFVEKTVNELVWGYNDSLITTTKKILPKDQQMPFDKFGFFYQKNGSTDGIFNVYTGANDISNYTIIDSFNYTKELSYWNTPECNKINGTDGTSYPPHLTKNDTIYLFNENLCRSLPLTYNNSNYHEGVESYRFVPPSDVFDHVSKKPENKCFCVGGPPCIGGGVFNISACKFNVSSVLSWPHFYQADQKYLDGLSGLRPDAKKHSLYIDVNPVLGMPLSAQARIQINFITMSLSTIEPVRNMTPMVFPVMWFEDGIDKLPPEVNEILYTSISVPKIMKITLLSISFVIGVVLCVVGTTCLILLLRGRRSNLPITKQSPDFDSSDGGHSNPVVSPENPD